MTDDATIQPPDVDEGIEEGHGGLPPARARGAAAVLRAVPFTAGVVAAMLVLGVVAQTLWKPLVDRDLFGTVAYGLPAFLDGRWWTPVTGSLFALTPAQYLAVTGGFAILVGWSEWRIGTRRAALATVGGQLAGVLGAALVLQLLGGTSSSWDWAARVSDDLDVGFSAGAVAAVAAASASLLAPWRARVRLVLVLYIVLAFLYIGLLWDLEHLIGGFVGLAIGPMLAGRGWELRLPRLTRHEWRVIAATLFLAAALIRLVIFFLPADGPLGDRAGQGSIPILVSAVISLVLAEGLRRGRRWAWRWAMALGLLSALVVLLLVVALVGGITSGEVQADDLAVTPTSVAEIVADLLLWATQLAVLVLGRKAFRAVSPKRAGQRDPQQLADREAGIALLHSVGGGSISWMGTWEANRWFVLREGGQAVGAQAYQVHRGVAIALGDPIGGDALVRGRVLDGFADLLSAQGLALCLFSVSDEVVAWGERRSLRRVLVAEESVIDLPGLQFKGKQWQDTRSALNRGKKEGVEYVQGALATMPRPVVAQVRAISEQWVGDKGLPEMGFTLGGVDEALDAEVRCGLAIDADGRVHGVTSWLPVYGPGGTTIGWTLDVMRRLPDGFRPVTEFLIASACLQFQSEGAQWVSLSGAPLAHSASSDDLGALTKLLDRLGMLLEPLYGFRSLDAFKAKFQPRHVPMSMVFPDEAALPRIGLALTEAYLPDASTADLAKAGLGALRGEG
ncbi:MAG: DUF2156 domain-containing protein [Actinobacteria bacterium]|nr:DUF2156 domain-containing protein [Actinomycetota bacterium]